MQNSEKKLTTSTNDKKIEETKHKSSKSEQVIGCSLRFFITSIRFYEVLIC